MLKQASDSFLNKDYFIAAVEFTAAQFGFVSELIEKDFLCSIILLYLKEKDISSIYFKGGTLLAKGYANFYRLSEDLDFGISISPLATRQQRREVAKPLKGIINSINTELPFLRIKTPLTGSNESRQYNCELLYDSNFSNRQGRILIEIGLREETIHPPVAVELGTLLRDPILNTNIIEPFQCLALTLEEAYAEKTRAALTRKLLAIRDFYDLHYAIKNNLVNLENSTFIQLIRQKIEIDNQPVTEFTPEKIEFLNERIATELIPTLRFSEKFSVDELYAVTVSLNLFLSE